MNKQFETRRLVEHQVGVNVGRRNLLKLTGVGVAVLSMMSVGAPAFAQSTLAWDKTFPKSERVDHRKVSFYNRLGITLVADLYVPKNIDRSRRHAALVVGGPYGAVKEQASGLYAQTMAERGFITIAHDPSYVGESGGQPHGIASSEALVEDFSAAVDFLGGLPFVDRERIGLIGVCGSGGFGLAAAEIDPRIKAVATVSMYDIGQAKRQGLAADTNEAALRRSLRRSRGAALGRSRWRRADDGHRHAAGAHGRFDRHRSESSTTITARRAASIRAQRPRSHAPVTRR